MTHPYQPAQTRTKPQLNQLMSEYSRISQHVEYHEAFLVGRQRHMAMMKQNYIDSMN
ncbi:MAG: hypothetical protein KC474_04660 [Cyanobacteria bacterium HKST-UBA04]|nr:hypothetical protein [Cyanobacteria bacterium HKST-UBA05]MCA9798819.1 hypothetical protein [Cyanobacteria bacterium HKST-UBA04]MCA9841844.1 hypothetical protein [Cyanobacteria bacterium HKST-UBA03]